jgi:2-keto-3-deoxy-L-fuconate dehydrogenase
MSKAALIGMTKSIALDYLAAGIRCNALCPGAIDTPGLQDRILASSDPADAQEELLRRHKLGRIGTAYEVAAACLYLASDDSAFMTGQLLILDGAMTL